VIKLKDLLTEEGGPGSGRRNTGHAPKIDPTWRDRIGSKRYMGSKEESAIDEGDHRKEAWDVLAQVKKDLKASFLTVKDVHKRFPLKGSQIALSNSAIEKISTASGWVDKLMKDIATG